MSESADKCRKSYVDHPNYRSKLTCLIHCIGNSSDECKVLGYFGSKYSKIRPLRTAGISLQIRRNLAYINRTMPWFSMQFMVSCYRITINWVWNIKHMWTSIIKSTKKKYKINKISLDEKKERCKCAFESKLENIYDIKR